MKTSPLVMAICAAGCMSSSSVDTTEQALVDQVELEVCAAVDSTPLGNACPVADRVKDTVRCNYSMNQKAVGNISEIVTGGCIDADGVELMRGQQSCTVACNGTIDVEAWARNYWCGEWECGASYGRAYVSGCLATKVLLYRRDVTIQLQAGEACGTPEAQAARCAALPRNSCETTDHYDEHDPVTGADPDYTVEGVACNSKLHQCAKRSAPIEGAL